MDIILVGIGALGSVIAKKLVSYADLLVIDRDFVEEKNLISQPIYDIRDIGKTKVEAFASKLSVKGRLLDVTQETIREIGCPDIIVCATDTFESKFLINDYCRKYKIPAIYVSAAGNRAMILPVTGKPCFNCIFRKSGDNCIVSGIEYETAAKVSEIVAADIRKLSSNNYKPSLVYVSGSESEKIIVNSSNSCSVCKGKYSYLDRPPRKNYRLCGGTYILHEKFNFRKLDFPNMKKFRNIVHYNGVSFFSDGRVFVRAKTEKEAKRIVISLIQNQ